MKGAAVHLRQYPSIGLDGLRKSTNILSQDTFRTSLHQRHPDYEERVLITRQRRQLTQSIGNQKYDCSNYSSSLCY